MTYSELIQLYFERSNALQWYWTLYVIIIGGLLAFSSQRKERDRLTTLLVTVLYCFFAYKNFGAIRDVTQQRLVTLDLIKQQSAANPSPTITPLAEKLEPTLQGTSVQGIRRFHVGCDVLTVAALWSMELGRKRAAISAQSPQKA